MTRAIQIIRTQDNHYINECSNRAMIYFNKWEQHNDNKGDLQAANFYHQLFVAAKSKVNQNIISSTKSSNN